MYVNSAYWNDSRIDFKDRKHPLFVGSCGTYRLLTRTKLPTHRPRGRVDFQLLYVAAGKGHFYFGGKEHLVPAGNMVLYRPREEQRYYYYGADQTEVYWVHFTGSSVTNILRGYGFRDDEHVIHSGTSLSYSQIFQQMIEELQKRRPHYEEACVCRLRLLLIMLSRLDETQTRHRTLHMAGQMNEAVRYFHANYMKEISMNAYAQQLGLSVSWFMRSFREYTGSSPAQYLISLRISAAQSLLETGGHNITEIAEMVGYDNPLYFSRLFRKQTGMSPSDFRRQLRAWNEEHESGGE
ncbi:MAG: AraC family transcriptional regulator [Lachnospiraceae bacterium]|nr:AraC family transcriptional regulator [Lachnospiraceae bacterium]